MAIGQAPLVDSLKDDRAFTSGPMHRAKLSLVVWSFNSLSSVVKATISSPTFFLLFPCLILLDDWIL